MAKVFGILTAIVLALAAFVAVKNKDAYQAEIEETQKQDDLLIKSEARLKAAKAVQAQLPIDIDGVKAEVDKLNLAEATQKKANDELTEKVSVKTAQIDSNKQKLDAIREKTQKTGDLKDLASKMRATNAELAELNTSIASTKSKLDNLTAQNASTEAQITGAKGKLEKFAKGESFPELKTRIRSIYPNWGFVTLASGNNAGVVTNSPLNVVRDGQVIAKLLVTAVESGSASASIVPDSLAPDTTLMVGDRVEAGQKTSGN
jgi:cell division protein FtsB